MRIGTLFSPISKLLQGNVLYKHCPKMLERMEKVKEVEPENFQFSFKISRAYRQ